jgi:hypothetical protein
MASHSTPPTTPRYRWGFAAVVAVCATALLRFVVACDSGTPQNGQDATTEGSAACTHDLVQCGNACSDLQKDPTNCGACGKACNAANAETCVMGACVVTCGGGSTKCTDKCVDLGDDPANCGNCGSKCDPGYACQDGGCALGCMNGLSKCDSDAGIRCVNPQTDDKNCGACGTKCPPGSKCDMGNCAVSCQDGLSVCQVDGGDRCTDLRFDTLNCGACGKGCDAGVFCSPPYSPDGGDAGPATCGIGCFGGSTKCGNRCVDTTLDPFHCGGCFKACDGGLSCKSSTCQ